MARLKSARSEEKTEASKRQIIEAATTVIAQQGLGKATLQAIAERAGLSSALVVFHFKSKDNLLKIVLGHLREFYKTGWEQALEPADVPAAVRLMHLITFDLEFPRRHPENVAAWYAFWGEARGGLLYQGIGRVGDDQCRHDIRQIVRDIIREGEYENVDDRTVAETIYVMIFGYWHVAHNEAERYDLQLAHTTFVDFLATRFPNQNWK